jgi:hypothetical protein
MAHHSGRAVLVIKISQNDKGVVGSGVIESPDVFPKMVFPAPSVTGTDGKTFSR